MAETFQSVHKSRTESISLSLLTLQKTASVNGALSQALLGELTSFRSVCHSYF